MTTREQFTDPEWAKVSGLSGLTIMAACLSDGHMMPSIREMKAGAEALTAGVQKHPDNEVLQAFVKSDSMKPTDETKGETQEATKVDGVAGAVTAMEAELGEGVALLKAKLSPEEFGQVSEVLTTTATAVVERIGGGFMGSGDKVTEGEKDFLTKLAAILAA
jgi:hypothetical protein